MKIALLFWGLTRSLKHTLPNLNEKILNHLKKNNIDYKIFIHTYKFEGKFTNPRSGEININLDFEEYKLLNPDYFQIDNQDEVKKKINIDKFKKYRFSYDVKTTENLICALYSQYQVTKLLENSKEQFDYVWFLRPDVIFKEELPLRWLNWVNNNKFIVPIFGSHKGINDRMAILKYELALKYGKRFNRLEEYCIDLKNNKVSSERFLKWVMIDYKCKKINYFFKRLRSNGYFHDLDNKLF